MKLPFWALFKIIMEGRSSTRFLIAAILSFAFSIAVILCTVGLMDGFESTLVKSLQNASGDLILNSRDGFFHYDKKLLRLIESPHVEEITPIIQLEGFAINGELSKGVLVKGIDTKTFSTVTGLDIQLNEKEIVVGQNLLNSLDAKVGDELYFAFASDKQSNQGSPILTSFTVAAVVEHGVYEKDLRFVYMPRSAVIDLFDYTADTANVALVKTSKYIVMDELKELQHQISLSLPQNFYIETFWNEYKTLLDAVEVEKISISMILQLIVVVAIFNIIAFVIFISEKKSQELFLLRALGLCLQTITRFWFLMMSLVWVVSCFASVFMTEFFNYLLVNLSFFKLPGEIYVLNRLSVQLTTMDYVTVFGLAFLWILVIGVISIYRLKKKSLLHGLRQEFA